MDPHRELAALGQALVASGLQTRVRLPDDEDPLGSALTVWVSVDEDGQPADVVEVVNFHNPGRVTRTPASGAIARARALPGSPLRCATIEDLIALKLYAGGLMDHADIGQLLAHNPGADVAGIRSVAAPFDTGGHLEALIDQAASIRPRRR